MPRHLHTPQRATHKNVPQHTGCRDGKDWAPQSHCYCRCWSVDEGTIATTSRTNGPRNNTHNVPRHTMLLEETKARCRCDGKGRAPQSHRCNTCWSGKRTAMDTQHNNVPQHNTLMQPTTVPQHNGCCDGKGRAPQSHRCSACWSVKGDFVTAKAGRKRQTSTNILTTSVPQHTSCRDGKGRAPQSLCCWTCRC